MILYKENGESSPPPTLESSNVASPEKIELQELGKNLSLSDEVIGKMEQLSQEEKEELGKLLTDIQQEIQKGGYTKENMPEDIKKRVQDTLDIYGIKFKYTIDTESGDADRIRAVEENVQSVKDLSPDIVNTELESFKKTSPLPDDVATKIAEKTGSTKEEVIQGGGKNPSQVKNLVDAYYLSSDILANNVISKLPESDKQKADTAFRNLRSSMNDGGIPSYPVSSKEVQKLIPDMSRATQEKVLAANEVVTHGSKDMMVSREGNTLSYYNSKNPQEITHTIDLNKKPPELIKKEGILESKRTLAEKPDTKMAEEREKREQEYKKIEIAGETLKQKSESLTPITEGATEDDTKKLGEISYDALRTTSKEIATETKKRPLDRAKITTLLQTQKEQVSNLRTKYDDYIAEGKERDFPEGLEEENRRRTLIDTTLHTLEGIEKTGESLGTSLESLPPEKKEEKDEAQKANESFETVSNHNLSMLRDLGFDKWDSMDDVTAFIDYADGKSRSNSGQEFPRNENGEINLGARKIGEEGKYLIDSLHTLLGSNQKQENPESSKNVIEKYRDIRSDLALGSRGQILTNYHLLKLDHGGELSRSILESRTKAPAETGKPAPTQTPETPPQ